MMKWRFAVLLLFCCAFACAPKETIKSVQKEELLPATDQLVLPEIKTEKKKPEELPKKAEKVATAAKHDEQYIMLNFENADLETVINTVGEMLNINYILTPGISGKITIQSHQKVPISELFSVFQTILEFNGFTAIKDGSYYRIVPIDSAKQQPVPIASGKESKKADDSSFVTQWVPLEYTKANDIANIVRNLMPRGTDIIVYEPSNMLIVTALPSGIVKLMKLLEAIDVPATERDTVRTFVYNVENGEAGKLASILKVIYGDRRKSDKAAPVKTVSPQQPSTTTPTPVPAKTPARPAPAKPAVPAMPASVQEGLAGDIEGDVIIEAYDDINALIIKTSPRGYLTILETLKKLDIQPKQVLIEVLIAEISLDDNLKFGVEWLLQQNMSTFGVVNTNINIRDRVGSGGDTGGDTGGTTVNIPSASAFAKILDPSGFLLLIHTAASLGKVNVIASPHVLSLDNQEAKIEIGDEVPVATSISQPQTTTDNTISQVQYRQTGTILTVTPQINEKKQVSLKVTQEVSELGAEVSIGTGKFQGFRTRKASTTAIVQDGHTLVIGGIIYDRIERSRSGVPYLVDLPLLGYLFGTTTDNVTKRELIFMVTPHVVGNRDEADMLTSDFQGRVKDLQKRIEERNKKFENEEKKEKSDKGEQN